jgi:hypothetical protein
VSSTTSTFERSTTTAATTAMKILFPTRQPAVSSFERSTTTAAATGITITSFNRLESCAAGFSFFLPDANNYLQIY